MPISLRIDGIRRVGPKVLVRSGKEEREFQDPATVRAYVADLEARELLLRLLLRWWLLRNPSGDTPALVVGKTITLDLEAATLLKVE